MSERDWEAEICFPYDKVKVSYLRKVEAENIANRVSRGAVFKVSHTNGQGMRTGRYSIINPAMVTHVEVFQVKPF